MIIHNVDDRRRSYVGSWEAEPLDYAKLTHSDVGRTVIYRDHGRAEAGTLTSWKNGTVFARYSRGDTAAGAAAESLVFGLRSLDIPEEILEAVLREQPETDESFRERILTHPMESVSRDAVEIAAGHHLDVLGGMVGLIRKGFTSTPAPFQTPQQSTEGPQGEPKTIPGTFPWP